MPIIKMNREQHDFMQKLVASQTISISTLSKNKGSVIIEISECAMEKIRDMALDYLDIYGFDEKYELTYQGQLAENLVDLFEA
ncbi:MAG: hypothetical protein ACK5IQ_04950 [Bacteroidales bacterium]